MSKPMRAAGITKEVLFAEMAKHPNAKIRAMIPTLRATKGWTVDDLFSLLCKECGTTPEQQLGLKK